MTAKRLCLVLHLNQNVTPNASIAAAASYRLLLDFLRHDPRRRVTLHVSGTLLIALGWLEPDLLTGLAELVAAGQVELLGSTFAQSIPWTADPISNDLQVWLHRRWLAEWFGAEPRGFWNPERCWGADYVDLITAHGYDFTFVEDPIAESGGLPGDASIGALPSARPLRVLRDDRELRHLVNAAVWSGDHAALDRYLSATPRAELCFAEDGEAIGLWALEHGHDPRAHWHHLSALVTHLEARGDVTLATCSDVVRAAVPVPMRTPPDGQATWMVDALQQPGARFHEAGFRDWFDYVQRSPQLERQRAALAKVRAATREVLIRRADLSPIDSQIQVAYCTHEYELGCIGVLHLGPGQFAKIRYTTTLAHLRDILADTTSPRSRWCAIPDREGGAQLPTWVSTNDVVVFARYGQIASWFDRRTGRALCGNELETSVWDDDDDLPASEPIQSWIDEYRDRITQFHHGDLEHQLPAELRDVVRSAAPAVPTGDRFHASHREVFLFQGTGTPLVQWVGDDGIGLAADPKDLAKERLPLLGLGQRIIAMHHVGTTPHADGAEVEWRIGAVSISRRVHAIAGGLELRDTITRPPGAALEYATRHALSPGYDRLALRGRRALTPLRGDAGPCAWSDPYDGVFNTDAELGVQLRDYGAARIRIPGAGLLAALVDLVWVIPADHEGPFVARSTLRKLTSLPG